LIHLDFARRQARLDRRRQRHDPRNHDGGLNWSRQRTGHERDALSRDFVDDERGWAVGERGTILRTTNGGETWTTRPRRDLQPRTTFLSVGSRAKNRAGSSVEAVVILRSDDGGRSWVQQESGTKQHLYALFVGKKQNWAVGGDGMVLHYER
jgi:photosystem II stability/assembly factor-like uncharacterized protein